jgi:hypothetical protein
MVQRCGCYSDAAAVVACIKLLQVTEKPFQSFVRNLRGARTSQRAAAAAAVAQGSRCAHAVRREHGRRRSSAGAGVLLPLIMMMPMLIAAIAAPCGRLNRLVLQLSGVFSLAGRGLRA